MSVYGTRTVSRQRRSHAELRALDDAILATLAQEHPATVRSVYYLVVGAGVVAKTEQAYRTVQRRVLALRRDGRCPWAWITDGTRWRLKPESWTRLDEMLADAAASYRRDLWHSQPVYVEVWSEKDAITGTIQRITDAWDVPVMVARGFASETFLHCSAEELAAQHRPCVIYQLGDHDPSGVAAARHVEAKLREFAPAADITFTRLAVTERQIVEMNLPTRPTKTTDSRAAKFAGESVEVDAIPPSALRRIVEDAITRHVDRDALALTERVEASERDVLARLIGAES